MSVSFNPAGVPPQPQNPRRRPLSFGCAIAVALIMAIAIIAGIINGGSDDDPEPTATPAAYVVQVAWG